MVGRFVRLRQKHTRNSDQSESIVRKTSDTTDSPMIGQPSYCAGSGQNPGLCKAGIIIAAVTTGLILVLICALLAVYHESRASNYTRSGRSSPYHRKSDNYDSEREEARTYIDSLPEGQRRAFYGGSSDPTDRANLLTNILESDNLDGAIKVLESER